MTQRSIWSEGIFGQIKEDNHYDKLRRRGISGVKTGDTTRMYRS